MPNHNSMQKFLLHFPSRTIIAHNLYALFIGRYFCFMGYYLKTIMQHNFNSIQLFKFDTIKKLPFNYLKNPVSTSTSIVKLILMNYFHINKTIGEICNEKLKYMSLYILYFFLEIREKVW